MPTAIATLLLETILRFLLEYLTDPGNQEKAQKYIKQRVKKRVGSRSKKWDADSGKEALKFFGLVSDER